MVIRGPPERRPRGYSPCPILIFPSAGEYANFFGITKKTLDQLKKKVVLMHPGPINRGVELSTDAADSEYSIILDQVQNGVAIRMSVLYLLANSN